METFTYDLYLLISTKESNGFGIVGMQTNDIFILRNNEFLSKK
jgi:hypothetical protein